MKRRTFLRHTSLATAAIAMPWIRRFPDDRKIGIALLGLGNYATNLLAPSFAFTEHCYLAGVVTGTPAKAKEWMTKHNLPAGNVYNYDNFDEIRNNDAILAVYVVTPNALHSPFVIRAAQAGKHVLCEKPMEISVERAQSMIGACEAAGVKLQIGYRCQYDPTHREIMRLGQDRVDGAVKVIDSHFSFYGVNGTNWRFTDPKLSGGGPLMDIGVYCMNAARYTTGENPVAITAQSFKTVLDKLPGMEETICWQMEFPSGAIANCTSSYMANANYIKVHAEKGGFGIEPAFSYDTSLGYHGRDQFSHPEHHQQAAQMDAFALNVLENTPVITDGKEGWRDMRVIEAIYEAARTGSRIKMNW